MTYMRRVSVLLLGLTLGGCATTSGLRRDITLHKPRVVVTTDPELDDSNSLVRYLLYSTDFQTEGLIYASSQFLEGSGHLSWRCEPFGRDVADDAFPGA